MRELHDSDINKRSQTHTQGTRCHLEEGKKAPAKRAKPIPMVISVQSGTNDGEDRNDDEEQQKAVQDGNRGSSNGLEEDIELRNA